MSQVRLVHIKKSYGSHVALQDIHLNIAMGAFFTLLGPSGCGKTTLLRAIAGFHLSVPLAQAVLDQRPALATSPADLLQRFKAQFPDQATVTVADTVELLRRVPVCIISGGQVAQFRSQVLERLDLDDELASRLHLMPTCGTQYYRWDGTQFAAVYAQTLSETVGLLDHAALEDLAR